jgi:hypothetical protein
LPRLLPFAALLVKTPRRPTRSRSRQPPDASVVRRRGPLDPDETVELGRACEADGRMLIVEWPAEELRTRTGRARFEVWHRRCIDEGLLQTISIVVGKRR